MLVPEGYIKKQRHVLAIYKVIPSEPTSLEGEVGLEHAILGRRSSRLKGYP